MMRRCVPSDLATINLWRAERGLGPLGACDIPGVGFIEEGAAVGFLLRTESPTFAMVDGLVTCHTARLRRRHAAALRVVDALCEEAKRLGVTRLCAFTCYQGVAALAERSGFTLGPMYQAMQKELT